MPAGLSGVDWCDANYFISIPLRACIFNEFITHDKIHSRKVKKKKKTIIQWVASLKLGIPNMTEQNLFNEWNELLEVRTVSFEMSWKGKLSNREIKSVESSIFLFASVWTRKILSNDKEIFNLEELTGENTYIIILSARKIVASFLSRNHNRPTDTDTHKHVYPLHFPRVATEKYQLWRTTTPHNNSLCTKITTTKVNDNFLKTGMRWGSDRRTCCKWRR